MAFSMQIHELKKTGALVLDGKKLPLEKDFKALSDKERLDEIGRMAGQLRRMYPLAPDAVVYGIAGKLIDLDQAAARDGMSLEEYSKIKLKILAGLSSCGMAGQDALKKENPKQYGMPPKGDGRLGDLPPMRQ